MPMSSASMKTTFGFSAACVMLLKAQRIRVNRDFMRVRMERELLGINWCVGSALDFVKTKSGGGGQWWLARTITIGAEGFPLENVAHAGGAAGAAIAGTGKSLSIFRKVLGMADGVGNGFSNRWSV